VHMIAQLGDQLAAIRDRNWRPSTAG